MRFERGGGGFRVSVHEGVVDLPMFGEHLQKLRGALMRHERRMNHDDDQLAARDRLEQCCIGAMRQSVVMKIALDPLEFVGLDLTGAGAAHSVTAAGELALAQMWKRLTQRFRLQEPADLEMMGDVAGRQRPGVPALVAVLNRDAGSFELGQHFMRNRAADVEVLGERALIEKEPPVDDACRDRMLDGAINMVAVVANPARLGEIYR